MNRDVRAILWKEWREIRGQPGGWMMTGWRSNLAAMILLGIYFGMSPRVTWVLAGFGVIGFGIMMAITQASDAFAGERERHTLETLFSTRMSEAAVLIGKVAAIAAYGWVLSLACIFMILLTTAFRGEITGDSPVPVVWLGMVAVLAFLAIWLISTIGALISFRSATSKQAQQTLMSLFFAVLGIPLVLAMLAVVALQSDRVVELLGWVAGVVVPVREILAGMGAGGRFFAVVGILLVMNGLALRIALRAVRRENLILP